MQHQVPRPHPQTVLSPWFNFAFSGTSNEYNHMVSILWPLSVSGFYTHSWYYIYELCSYLWLNMPSWKHTTVCPISWRGTPEPFLKGKSFIQRILKRFINILHSLVCISRILPRTELRKYSQVYVMWHHALGWGLRGGSKLTRRFLASLAENLVPQSRAQEPGCREHTSIVSE